MPVRSPQTEASPSEDLNTQVDPVRSGKNFS